MSDQIDHYAKRPMRYQHIDGLDELLTGVWFIVFPLLGFFIMTAGSGSVWHRRTTFFLCLAAFALVVSYGYKLLKKRITHPRTGYVKYRQDRMRGRLVIGVTVAVAIAAGTAFVLRRLGPHSSELAGPALVSAAFGLYYVVITRLDAAWRWIVLVALGVAPPAVAMLPLGRLWLGNLPIALDGMIFFLSGAITLTLYLRRNPVPEQAAE